MTNSIESSRSLCDTTDMKQITLGEGTWQVNVPDASLLRHSQFASNVFPWQRNGTESNALFLWQSWNVPSWPLSLSFGRRIILPVHPQNWAKLDSKKLGLPKISFCREGADNCQWSTCHFGIGEVDSDKRMLVIRPRGRRVRTALTPLLGLCQACQDMPGSLVQANVPCFLTRTYRPQLSFSSD